jgi:hypothetical protein
MQGTWWFVGRQPPGVSTWQNLRPATGGFHDPMHQPAPGSRYHRELRANAFHRSLMSERLDFKIVCPNDHEQTVTFNKEEFEAELKSGALVFHCNTCEANWPPCHEDIVKIRKTFSKTSA